MKLDVGGIAKGYAAQAALDVLKRAGVNRALVGGAGDIVVGDAPPGKDGWTIAIAPLEPDKPGAALPALLLANAAVSTAGDAERFVIIDGRRYSHIINPATGQAVEDRASVTVVAPDGGTADALETTVYILGPERGLKLVEETPGAAAIYVRLTPDGIKTFESVEVQGDSEGDDAVKMSIRYRRGNRIRAEGRDIDREGDGSKWGEGCGSVEKGIPMGCQGLKPMAIELGPSRAGSRDNSILEATTRFRKNRDPIGAPPCLNNGVQRMVPVTNERISRCHEGMRRPASASRFARCSRLVRSGRLTDGQLLDRICRLTAIARRWRSRRSWSGTGRWSWASAGGCSPTHTLPKTPFRRRFSSSRGEPKSVRNHDSLGGWLHRVARRIAMRLRSTERAPQGPRTAGERGGRRGICRPRRA